MSQEERIEQLETENAQVRGQYVQLLAAYEQLQARYTQLEASYVQICAEKAEREVANQDLGSQVQDLSQRVHELEGPWPKTATTVINRLEVDGYAKKTRSLRHKSGKKPGGQAGHQGHTLELAANPDEIVVLRPQRCAACRTSLEGVAACGMERRQRVDASADPGVCDRIPSSKGALSALKTARTVGSFRRICVLACSTAPCGSRHGSVSDVRTTLALCPHGGVAC